MPRGGSVPELFKFQRVAIQQFLKHQYVHLHERGYSDTSALIGDDMGLGKTIEAITLDLNYRRRDSMDYKAQTLVVTMTSVMGAWEKHYEEWAPWLKVKVIDRKNRDEFIEAIRARVRDRSGTLYPAYHVFVCHWQVLRYIADELKEVPWFHIIGDEIQNIKNRKAQQTQVFKKLRTTYKTGLSGTWADNRPDDAWSVLNWLWPKKFTSYWSFFNYHVLQKKHNEGTCMAEGCDTYHRRGFTEISGVHDMELIHRMMGGAYIRRTKEQVWEDMPEKTGEDRYVELDPKQRRTYDMMANDMLAWVGEHEDQPLPASNVISQLVRLQQFAVAYGKLEVKYKDGQPYRYLVLDEPSSKLDAAIDIIGATNAQIVIFGQSKQALYLLEARLNKAKVSNRLLTGDVPQAHRDQFIAEFQSGSVRVFLSTIKAGGVGITLTAASICIFLDRDWSPTKNRQAEDRLHRLGQKNAVLIIVLVARNTIDPTRNAKIEMKWTWLRQVLEGKTHEEVARR
jgi:SNF2 family DNA or RNA helicase